MPEKRRDYRTIGKRRYRLASWWQLKSQAQNHADYWRKKGRSARVLPAVSFTGVKGWGTFVY